MIRVWCHQGQEAENRAMREMAGAFNAAHAERGVRVAITFFPDFQYGEKIAIAAAARDLPDVLDLDGPTVARFATAGVLQPIDRWFARQDLEDFLPTIIEQGTIDGRLYALGAFDSAAVLYYDRAMLARANVEPPPFPRGWTWDEFLDACAALRAANIEPVALHMNESADEWFTYAFLPVVWSAGGRIIDAEADRVTGALTSAETVHGAERWQTLFQRGFAAANPIDPDPFGNGATAMDWSGHWMARSHAKNKGENLGVMPLPTLGDKPVAPCGSWCWGMTSSARKPELAALWLRWATDPVQGVERIVRASGAVPARRSAFAAFPEYGEPPYQLFRYQLENFARARPRTPFYATLTMQFAGALRDIAQGTDVAARLAIAEREVQAVIDRRAKKEATP